MSDVKSRINPILTLSYITKEDENKYFDRKSAKIKPSDIADLISAFANAEGGTVVIGISDKTRKLEGVNGFGTDKINNFVSAPKDYCRPMPHYKEEFINIINVEGIPIDYFCCIFFQVQTRLFGQIMGQHFSESVIVLKN